MHDLPFLLTVRINFASVLTKADYGNTERFFALDQSCVACSSFSNDFEGFLNYYLDGFENCLLFDLENPALRVRTWRRIAIAILPDIRYRYTVLLWERIVRFLTCVFSAAD